VPDREEEGTWAPDTLSFHVPEANDVAPANPGLPERFAIEGAWPNPFNAATTLKLALPTPGTVQIALYDLLGREVARLARGEIAAGRHKIALDGSRLASGTYLVRALGPAGQRALQRVTLVK
jgi:hypothetical protein